MQQCSVESARLQDIVERFHLVVALAFVLVEEMANNGRARPDAALLRTCAYFFSFEIVIGPCLGSNDMPSPRLRHTSQRGEPLLHLQSPLQQVERFLRTAAHDYCAFFKFIFSTVPTQLVLLLSADVTKHAVLGKFNEIRPGMYREFMKVRCRPPLSLQYYKRCLHSVHSTASNNRQGHPYYRDASRPCQ
jgi:hypothetical protein